jgi:hypothetical protein
MLRRGPYGLVRRHDDKRVTLFEKPVVIMSEGEVLVRVEVVSDVGEGEPAHLGETEETFGA